MGGVGVVTAAAIITWLRAAIAADL